MEPTDWKQKTSLWPVAISRILIGVMWLFSLRWKLPPRFTPASGRGLLDWLQLEVQHPAFGFYAEFVESIVVPNFTLFAWIIFTAELFVGLSLLTGTLVRVGGAIGLLMSINLGIGLLEVPGEWPWSYLMMAMWHGTFIITAAGRLWGFDAILNRKMAGPWLYWLS